ncbi:uncharacterized protein BYT42DRAFT_588220 [Radiomyces spectabilis]|uniref:uncharacterized protein n=1 Tax=Radiomyces spectabilis TaxID=64574 RepID=UPI0022209D15|nr:uncharacterized protein BYT42DRAFT_588220 [Radiomyces spectabilis]KAI8365921.1 hypothetical protein BYT42DRAFT_588220 [Radiomyces spectabilis]
MSDNPSPVSSSTHLQSDSLPSAESHMTPAPSDKMANKQDLYSNEQAFNNSLREQLEQTRKDKASLEAELQSRADTFQATLGRLQSGTSQTEKMFQLDDLMNILELDQLKSQTKKLHERCVEQEARIKKLEFDLEMEQGHVNILRHDNQRLRQMTVDMTALAEQEEEYISNKLLKRITGLKKEKGELLIQVEQEEEYMTNMLQKKLNRLQKEKIDMENALEQEQEFIVNKLQKQLDSLRSQQSMSQASSPRILMQDTPTVPAALSSGTSPSLNPKKWMGQHGAAVAETPSGLVETLLAEIASLKNKTNEMEKEFLSKTQQCNKYKSELLQFRKQHKMPTDDIPSDEGIPLVFRSVPPSPSRQVRGNRSTSTSSQRSLMSDKTGININAIPPLQLDNTGSPAEGSANASSPQPIAESRQRSGKKKST